MNITIFGKGNMSQAIQVILTQVLAKSMEWQVKTW